MELKEYVKIVKKRLWLVVLIVLISTLTTAAYSNRSYIPIYHASTQLIINKTITLDELGNEQMDLQAIGVNIGLVNTYKEIIQTPAIMDEVVQRYPELQVTSQQLIRMVGVSSLNGTQVMTLETTDFSYARAANIVNAVADVVRTEIPRIMKVNNVEILNVADPNDQPQPINQPTNLSVVISFAVSLMVAVGIAFLLEFMDDTIKTKKDIQATLGLRTLSQIPAMKKKDFALPKVKKQSRNKAGDAAYVTVKN